MATKNPCNKERSVWNPYEIWENDSGWQWRVLKKWQTPEKEAANPYARWFCAVSSPFTYGGHDYGDVYVAEIKSQARLIYQDTGK